MHQPRPLSDLTRKLQPQISHYLDALALRTTPAPRAWWFDDHAIVHVSGREHHVWAPGNGALESSLAALASVRPWLTMRHHLYAGRGLGGALCKTHQVEMIGPFQRFINNSRHIDSSHTVAISPREGRSLTQINRSDDSAWGHHAGLGLVGGRQIIAAVELLVDDPVLGVARLGPVRAGRGDGAADRAVALLQRACAALPGRTVFHDVRMDRRRRYDWALQAGMVQSHTYEHWLCKPHPGTRPEPECRPHS